MGSPFRIINIVAEAQHVLAEFVGKLKCYFYLDTISLAFQINRIMQNLCTMIQIFDKSNDSIRLMINDLFRLRSPLIFEHDLKIRVQIRCLMKPAFYLFCFELCLFKYGIIRKEIHLRSGLSCLSDRRQ